MGQPGSRGLGETHTSRALASTLPYEDPLLGSESSLLQGELWGRKRKGAVRRPREHPG